jgi:adenylate kinase family enzyme
MAKVKIGDKEIYFDGHLQANLEKIKTLVRKDWDWVTIIDGTEGSGKSVLAQQVAAYLDPTLNIDRVCFEPEEFKKAIVNADKYQAVIFDEAFRGMSARRAMSEINHTLNSMMLEIRQKNLFIFIVLPSFFHLDGMIALWRSRMLLHVYTSDWKRGRFAFFNEQRKKGLYISGKKFFSYNKPRSNFTGRFTKGYYIEKELYLAKKEKVLRRLAEEDDPNKTRANKYSEKNKIQRTLLINILRKDKGMSYNDIAQSMNTHYKKRIATAGSIRKLVESAPVPNE